MLVFFIILHILERGACVYILTNKNNTTLYTGVTSDLQRRIVEHKTHYYPKSFTARYDLTKLVYFEFYSSVEEAIEVEKKNQSWFKN